MHMGTTDISRGDPEVTTGSEHLSKEPGHPDRAPIHPMVKENILVRSKSFLKMNEPQDPTKDRKILYMCKQVFL